MKQFLILFSIAVCIANAAGKHSKWGSWFLPHFKDSPKKQPQYFTGLHGMKPEQTTQYIVAQLGPGLVTDMTIFASCGGKPIRFTEQQILAGFNCKSETSYSCYKVCQLQKLGLVNEKDMSVEGETLENHILGVTAKSQNRTMDDLEECFKGKTIKNDGKCMGMKNAMQCVWDSYYKNCEPSSEFSKNKRLVQDSFWADEEKDD